MPALPESGSTTSYSRNSLNQYTSVGGTGYSYDNNGNLTDDGTYLYYYDCENHLTDVNDKSTGNPVSSYSYDYQGRRISKTVSGVTTKYCYDGAQVIAEYDGSNNLLRKFIYGPGIDKPICMLDIAEGKTFYYHFDGLGSAVALSNENKEIVERYSYDVFGEPSATSSIGNPYLFTGRRYEPETGLYYYRARYYAYDIGRFLQTDPIGYDDGLNLYAYCGNNPLEWTDPSGLCKGGSFLDRFSNFVRASDPLTSLGAFGIGILEGVYDMERGLFHMVRHPVGTVKGIPAGIMAIPDAAKQMYRDLTSSDPYTFGNAIGKLTAQIEIALISSKVAGKLKVGKRTEIVQRHMSVAELKATANTGLLRGGRKGIHYVTDAANKTAKRARQRLSISSTPEIRVKLEVPAGKFSLPSKVQPKFSMPGGGLERTATGNIPVKIIGDY